MRLVTWLPLLVWVVPVVCQTLGDSLTLYKQLLTGYEKGVRPALNQSEPLTVQFEFDLLSIREVDDIIGKLSIIGVVYLRWKDPRLTWNPYLYNGTFMMNIPQEKVSGNIFQHTVL